MKLLHAARMSRLGDASTGLEKQDDEARRFAAVHDHEIVGTVADENISGDSDPFARPGLGQWLTKPELAAKYEGIVAAFLDRLGRSARHLQHLREWAEDNGKTLIVVNPSLKWPVDDRDFGSKVMWDILSLMAEYELDMIKRRSVDTRKKLIAGGYLVGRAPFGFRIVPLNDHKTLEPDPETAPYVRKMAERYLNGESLSQICTWLESEGVKPSQGGMWTHRTVSQILRNPVLIGRQMEKEEWDKPKKDRKPGKTRRTILRVPPILDVNIWEQVQARLDNKGRRKGIPSGDTAMLTGILRCGKCGRPMYRIHSRRTGPAYYCRKPTGGQSCKNLIQVDVLDNVSSILIANTYGHLPHLEHVWIPGNTYSEELIQNRLDIQELDPDDPTYSQRHAALIAERERLRALPAVRGHFEEHETDETEGQYWASLDTVAARRAYLLRQDYRLWAHRKDDGSLAFRLRMKDRPVVEGLLGDQDHT